MPDLSSVSLEGRPQLLNLYGHRDFAPWNAMLKFILDDYKISQYTRESVPRPPYVHIYNSPDYTAESIKAVEVVVEG